MIMFKFKIVGDKMIIDITGIELTPGNLGENCIGNGKNKNIECCCDECDYLMCCIDKNYTQKCLGCTDKDCPRRVFK